MTFFCRQCHSHVIYILHFFDSLRIRIGGSSQDQILYMVGNAARHCPPVKRRNSGLYGFSNGCLAMDRWATLNNLMNKTISIYFVSVVTFGLNTLMGRRKLNNEGLYGGDWGPTNAYDFMNYTASKCYKIESYELVKDTMVLKEILAELYPDAPTRPKVVGPGGYYNKEGFDRYLQASGPNTYEDVLRSVKEYGPWSNAWVGESGGAYNTGGRNTSHNFVSGFWFLSLCVSHPAYELKPFECVRYLDRLGMTSTFDHKTNTHRRKLWSLQNNRHSQSKLPRFSFVASIDGQECPENHSLWRSLSTCILTLLNEREEDRLTAEDSDILSNFLLLSGSPLELTESLDILPNESQAC
ncbi:Glycoside hydrolase, family 79 [Dillenia turbinata]|uniref:Glycoside hydrolase, family 79 n=1 Tax=Dillenia turbinata TaxID=194707 RepID=A0AAN8YX18_9MAGN